MDYSLKILDYTIEELDLSNKNLTVLPDLSKYINLKVLKCNDNKITNLDNLPPGLLELKCLNNKITNLDNLPPGLTILYCWNNNLTSLDNLPPGLKQLYCGNDEWQKQYFTKNNTSRLL